MPGLRERKKAEVGRAILAAATRLMVKRGFDAATMDEIAAQAGVARRTLFRYFPTKESLLFAGMPGDAQLAACFAARRPGEDDVGFVLRVLVELRARVFDRFDPKHRLALRRMVREVPSLAAESARQMNRAREAGVRALVGRRPSRRALLRARVLVGACVMAVDCARTSWVEGGGRGRFEAVVDETKPYLRTGFSSARRR